MIPTIMAISLAFLWLLIETDWMRIRLPMGKVVNNTMPLPEPITEVKHNPIDTPYYWMTPEQKEWHIMLCHNCNLSSRLHSWRTCHKDEERWTAWKLPAKTIQAFNSTLTLAEGCNIQRALLLKDIAREHKRKATTFKPCQLPMDAFIKTVRIGSHREWVVTTPKHGFHRIVEEYTTHYNDCLPGKKWLKAHEHDNYPEPTIELSIDGKSLSVNGDYKKGTIQGFMFAYTHKVRAGKKVMIVSNGDRVVNCGGGVYVIE